MPCGGCGKRSKPQPPKGNTKPCQKCGWPTRPITKYNLKTRKNELVHVCINKSCRFQSK